MLKVKNHSNFGKHIKSLLLACAVLSVAFFFVLRFNSGINEASAQATAGSMTGWAWSDNIGWIDFAPAGGGVQVDASGNLTGYAWSDNVGWLKFGGLSGFPSGTGTLSSNAKITGSTLVGWARFCAGTVESTDPYISNRNLYPRSTPPGNCSTDVPRPDGWDGWVSLSGSTYGATYTSSTGAIGGYAWGSDVVGWIEFRANVPVAPTIPTVTCNVSPSPATTGQSVTWTASASGGAGTGAYTYSWTGTDSLSGSGVTATKTYSTAGTKTATVTATRGGVSGSCTNTVVVNNPSAPTVTCNVSPSSATTGQSVTWTASASGGAGTGAYTYSWTGTDSLSGSGVTATKTYSTAGTKTATVTATRGGVSGSCTNTVVVNSSALTYTVSSSGNPVAMNAGGQYIVSASVNPNNRISVSRTSGAGTSGSVTLTPTVTKGGVADTGITVSNIAPTPCALNDTNTSCQSTYTLNATASASGTYRVTFSAGGRSAGFDVVVYASSAPYLTCTSNYTSVNIGETVVYTVNASISGTGQYTYSLVGSEGLNYTNTNIAPSSFTDLKHKIYQFTGTKTVQATINFLGLTTQVNCPEVEVVAGGGVIRGYSQTPDTTIYMRQNSTHRLDVSFVSFGGYNGTINPHRIYNGNSPAAYATINGTYFDVFPIKKLDNTIMYPFTLWPGDSTREGYITISSGGTLGTDSFTLYSSDTVNQFLSTITVNVTPDGNPPPPATPFDYNLTGGANVELYTGETRSGNLTATYTQGPAGTANVSAVSSSPSSVTASVPSPSCNVSVGGSCPIGYTITVPYNATPGTYTVTFTGTGGPSQKSKTINVTVLARSLSCSVTPTQPTVGSTVRWTANPTPSDPTPLDPTYTYTWTGAPNVDTSKQVASRVVSAPGVYTGNVEVRLGGNLIAPAASCSVTVLPGGSGEY